MLKSDKQKLIKEEREKSDFEQRVLGVDRVVRVVAGGRRFRFRAIVAIGNYRGQVGVGIAKGFDVANAIEKAVRNARKNLINVPITSQGSIPFEVEAKYAGAKILLKPASQGRGIKAGGTMRVICTLAGIENITGKILSRSNNKINNARATIKALKSLSL